MIISPDSQVLLLLCSYLGLPSKPDPAPLTLKEWNYLARKLQSASLRPEAFLDLNGDDIRKLLNLSNDESKRIMELMSRRGSLAIELERLESLGIRSLTRADSEYPQRYRSRLKDSAPIVLFYAGSKALLGQRGVAVVGSRDLGPVGQEAAAYIGNACAYSGMVLYSGGAKGVDTISMNSALNGRGTAVGILANGLEKAIRNKETRAALTRGDLCLVTPYSPNAGFSVGNAMGRNKLIYSIADYAIVVASAIEKGGTWAGATQGLKEGWVPVFILDYPEKPEGNQGLIEMGGFPFPFPFPDDFPRLSNWLEEHRNETESRPKQLGLF